MRSVTFGPFVFDPARGVLLRDGRPVAANQKGVRLLAALLRTPRRSGRQGYAHGCGFARYRNRGKQPIGSDRGAPQLLGAEHDGGDWIATVPRVGYRFAGAVLEPDGQNAGIDTAETRPVIAVLPFSIVSNEQGKDYLADGITDDIITALTRYRWFRVVVRGSVFALRDNLIDAGKTAHQLGARYALHGSVRHSQQQLRIWRNSSTLRMAPIYGPSVTISRWPMSSRSRTRLPSV